MQKEDVKLLRSWELFDLIRQKWTNDDNPPIELDVYVNKRGDMIEAKHRRARPGLIRYIAKHGIRAQKASSKHSVCSIGKADDGRWHGWSHRAVCSFGKGDRIFEEEYGNDGTPFVKHGRKTIKTDADAKLAAKRFARSVS